MKTAVKTWGKDPHPLVSLEQAWEIISRAVEAHRPSVQTESVEFSNACGRILAAPVIVQDDYPAFDKAMMDGFAVRAADCITESATLAIIGIVPAGGMFDGTVGTGQAVRINTGAPLPSGADAVVKIEDCEVAGNVVTVRKAARAEQSVTRKGNDRKSGDIVLRPPCRIGPAQVAAAATAGTAQLEVAKAVGAAIVSTGDELVRPGEARRPGQIFDSNGPMLSALLRQFGAATLTSDVGRDTRESLTDRFTEALKQPIVLSVGGMSMGTHDLVPEVLSALGVHWQFHGVHMRPGKPVAYGIGPAGQHVFGLPGNPVSAFVCAWLFVRMVVRSLLGYPCRPPMCITATCAADITAHRDARPAFIPARLWSDPQHGLMTSPCHWSGSADPFGLAEGNALIFLTNPTVPSPRAGRVQVLPVTDLDDAME